MVQALSAVARMFAAGTLIALTATAGAQQAYPNKPIHFIVATAAGSGGDISSRLVAQKLAENWGQPVIVDNRPGANMIIAGEALVKSPPDGYTILMISSSHVINPLLVPNLSFDALKDVAPVATITNSPYVLTINSSIPANNLREFVEYAKSRPRQLNFASSGTGSSAHLTAEILNNMVGMTIQHVPYKVVSQILNDLAGGQVQMYLATALTTLPYITAGKIKALAVANDTRLSMLPQVPTFAEAGVTFDVKNWFGIVAPAGTPKAIVDKLSTEIGKAIVSPDTAKKLASLGGEPFVSTPEQFAALMKADTAKFAKIIKSANIKIEK